MQKIFKLAKMAPPLQRAVEFSVVVQILIMLLASLVSDRGGAYQICSFAALGFGALHLLVLWRRRTSPTKMDLFLIRTGFVPTIIGTALLSDYIWTLRGF